MRCPSGRTNSAPTIGVVIALAGCIYMAMYNTGYQAHLAISNGALPLENWQSDVMRAIGMGAFDPANLMSCIVHGALYYLPVLIVTFAVGGTWEVMGSSGLMAITASAARTTTTS